MPLDAVKDAIRRFENQPADASEADLREAARHALKTLHAECVRVQEAAGDYPANAITADVWMDGANLGLFAEGFASLLKDRGLIDFEEKAHTLRCMAVLAVQGHYHHIVGPAMLARAECNERLGNAEFASRLHQAVVADFAWLADEASDAEDAPAGDDRAALECLAEAIQGVLRHQPEGVDLASTEALRDRCTALLARPSAG